MKILFLGDLRTCNNYGAIATTTELDKMLREKYPEAEIKYIDFRSMQSATPPNGWVDKKVTINKPTLLKRIRIKLALRHRMSLINKCLKFVLPYFVVAIKEKISAPSNTVIEKTKIQYHIPYLFSDYARWVDLMKSGDVLQYEKNLIEWADYVLINGEGNVVNGTDENGVYRHRACYLLFLAYFSKTVYGKKTFIVNHIVDPNNKDAEEIIKNVYPLLDKIIVRDPLSVKKLEELGISKSKFVPDALFAFVPSKEEWNPSEKLKQQIDFSKPYILIGDSSGIQNAYGCVKWDVPSFYSELIKRLRKIIPQIIFVDGYTGFNQDVNKVISDNGLGYVNLNNCSYKELYEVQKRAEIFISGRWHASILCVLSGTPILLWGADSHKTRALYPIMDYPYRFFETQSLPIHVDEIVCETNKILKDRNEIRNSFSQKCKGLSIRALENINFIQ